jgi:hypothetical protein
LSPTLAARRTRRAVWVFIAAGSAALIIGLVYVVATLLDLTPEVRNTQIEGTPTGRKLVASSERILDCTEPDGACYKASQARTAKAVGDINRVIVLAAACSVGLDPTWTVEQRQAEIQACVIDRLARSASKP